MMTAQELLQNSLSNLLILQKSSFKLTFSQAMDLSGAIDRINDILTALEEQGKDWEVAELEEFSAADMAVADMVISACRQ